MTSLALLAGRRSTVRPSGSELRSSYEDIRAEIVSVDIDRNDKFISRADEQPRVRKDPTTHTGAAGTLAGVSFSVSSIRLLKPVAGIISQGAECSVSYRVATAIRCGGSIAATRTMMYEENLNLLGAWLWTTAADALLRVFVRLSSKAGTSSELSPLLACQLVWAASPRRATAQPCSVR